MKKLSLFVIICFISLNIHVHSARATTNGFIKTNTSAAVYYLLDGMRYVFPTEATYKSWQQNFKNIQIISSEEMANYRLQKNITYKPGVRLVKIQSDPKVYAVSRNRTLRWVTSEALARGLYGELWNKNIDDIPVAFFIDYTVGSPILSLSDYSTSSELQTNIENELTEITGLPQTPTPIPTPTSKPTQTPTPTPEPGVTYFDVGDNQPYTSIGTIPWNTLKAGDTVRIHWRATPYHEMILLSTSGTADKHIRVVGVSGPHGERPIIDGQNATMSTNIQYAFPGSAQSPGTPNRGLVVIGPGLGYVWGEKPSYIDIENLEIKHAAPAYSFTDNKGAVRKFSTNAAAIFIERGEHITIKNCILTDSGNGLFAASGDSEEMVTRHILVQGNKIYGNGTVGSYSEHNVYTEAIDVVFEHNYFGKPRSGSEGNNFKDRSAGTVIRYNYFLSGGHIMDLVDPQDSSAISVKDPSFANTYVYGNILINDGADAATLLIHFGGDDDMFDRYRKNLYFYNNTLVNRGNQTGAGGRWRTIIFQTETNNQTVYAYNNIFYNEATTPGATPTELALMMHDGIGHFTNNWISPGYIQWNMNGIPNNGTQTETDTVSPTDNNPGFVNLSQNNVHLTANSSAVNVGTSLSGKIPNTYLPTQQYTDSLTGEIRPTHGNIDIGAFEN